MSERLEAGWLNKCKMIVFFGLHGRGILKDLEKVRSDYDHIAGKLHESESTIHKLRSELEITVIKTKENKSEYDRIVTELNRATAELERGRVAAEENKVEYDRIVTELNRATAELERGRVAAEENKVEYDRVVTELNRATAELERGRVAAEENKVEYDRVVTELNRAKAELNRKNLELVQANDNSTELRKLYLNLMEACLAGVIYEDEPLKVLGQKQYDQKLREYGWDWPSKAHTMIGSKRLANVRFITERIIADGISGDLIETGVWRGGACIMMCSVLAAYGETDRVVWLADSFEGLPAPTPELFPSDAGETFHTFEELSVSIDVVKENFEKYDLLDEKVKFLKGWFKDTLPDAPIDQLALLRLDGDLYESTIQPLNALYHKVAVGGYVIVDDYHVVKGCKDAIHDFFSENNIAPELIEIDGVGVYWQK